MIELIEYKFNHKVKSNNFKRHRAYGIAYEEESSFIIINYLIELGFY